MIYAIGDIHGSLKTLDALLAKLPYEAEDTLVFLGDYIDRGPDSRGVIERLIQLLDEHENLVFLRGNHEQLCLDAMRAGPGTEAWKTWMDPRNRGDATLDSYGGYPDASHLLMMTSLPFFYETDEYFFCHAGVDPLYPLHQQPRDTLLWMREPFIQSSLDYGKKIVFGHTMMEEVFITHNRIGVDSGCGKQRKLSAVALPSMQVYSVAYAG